MRTAAPNRALEYERLAQPDGTRIKHYYMPESVGMACGLLVMALHDAGLATLTHTPAPMNFLKSVLERPANERAYVLVVAGFPAPGACVPDIERKPLRQIKTVVRDAEAALSCSAPRLSHTPSMTTATVRTTPGRSVALVTGASSGIGMELARLHAARGGNLVVVARRGDRLRALADELRAAHDTDCLVVEADLATADGIATLKAATTARQIDVLINNAGFGARGAFHEAELARMLEMIDLNVRALTELTHHYVGPMVARGHGRVLQVGSTAGFLPGPLQAIYYASKAYVNSFAQATAEELRGTGVTVTVLAPGPVATEFFDVAGMERLSFRARAPSAAKVARIGYEAMLRGELVVIDDRRIGALTHVIGLIPKRLLLRVSRKSMEAES